MLDLEFINPNLEELSPLAIQGGHDKAFNVEAVTKQFFEDYKSVFHDLQDDLTSQTAGPPLGARLCAAVSQPLHVPLLHSAQTLAR